MNDDLERLKKLAGLPHDHVAIEKAESPYATLRQLDAILEALNEETSVNEVSPPGWKGTVTAMKRHHKKDIDNPYALAWYMKNKGYHSHKKKDGSNKK